MKRLGVRHKTGLLAVALLALLAQPATVSQAPAAALGVQSDDQPRAGCSLPADPTTPSDLDAERVHEAVDGAVEDAEERVCQITDEADGLVDEARERLSSSDDIAG